MIIPLTIRNNDVMFLTKNPIFKQIHPFLVANGQKKSRKEIIWF